MSVHFGCFMILLGCFLLHPGIGCIVVGLWFLLPDDWDDEVEDETSEEQKP